MQGHAECLESAGTEKAIIPSGSQNVAGFPVWHVVPQLLERSTLHALLDELSAHPPPAEPMSTYWHGQPKAFGHQSPVRDWRKCFSNRKWEGRYSKGRCRRQRRDFLSVHPEWRDAAFDERSL